ncbi:HD domain-containing protein [Cellulomonas sp. WB94]|uniref:HD domain-containing protein n=1 Tax=Cellulomonas sp. WB94 TaxID=2173174 RepID=UPI001F5B5894|nr:HD domain-containing protein [Cellulomonas sp. WB94]
MATTDVVSDAKTEAQRLLSVELQRWVHVAGVAEAAAVASRTVADGDTELLIAAAWLHDIGYSEQLRGTGFHPLDGARHLRAAGASDRLCRLVANHTSASVEADARGLARALAEEFPPEDSPTADALTYADLTTGAHGEPTTVEDRLADIYDRYPPGHVVHESIRRAEPDLIATVRRVEARLAAAQPR